mmetsp:Transcript_25946/g.56090  ORF Transcript_25946/g.56090 Transcript_25946/m.56090 type:complete len:235 (+) Transcript_25946:230-934(+)
MSTSSSGQLSAMAPAPDSVIGTCRDRFLSLEQPLSSTYASSVASRMPRSASCSMWGQCRATAATAESPSSAAPARQSLRRAPAAERQSSTMLPSSSCSALAMLTSCSWGQCRASARKPAGGKRPSHLYSKHCRWERPRASASMPGDTSSTSANRITAPYESMRRCCRRGHPAIALSPSFPALQTVVTCSLRSWLLHLHSAASAASSSTLSMLSSCSVCSAPANITAAEAALCCL